MCNNIYALPYPVIVNTDRASGAVTLGCLNNTQAVPDSTGGTVTLVVSAPSNRPATALNW